jgi:tRNA-dihydrouridine synthase
MKLDVPRLRKPVGILIFVGDEETAMSSKIVSAVNPDIGIINFGCPVKVVCKGMALEF